MRSSQFLAAGIFTTTLLATGCSNAAPGQAVAAAPLAKGPQQVLLSALEEGEAINQQGWRMKDFAVEKSAQPAKFGKSALTFRGNAEEAGGKGDFSVPGGVPGTCKSLSLWVYGADDANIASVGLQVWDGEGEFLIMQVPLDWKGWKQVEFDLATVATTQTWPQNDKNKKIDQPVRGVNIIWFAKAAGPTALTVDALTATTEIDAKSQPPVGISWSGNKVGEPNQPLNGQLVLTNFTDAAANTTVTYSIQRDPSLYSRPPIDPIFGSDQAYGAKSWTEQNGKVIEEGSLTDGKDWTNAGTTWGEHKETTQYVDLGSARKITKLALGASDGNWLWKIDVSASLDGKTYTPVPGLQGLDYHKNWSAITLPVSAPFDARFIKLRHHNDGQTVNSISMPSSLSAFDGVADEKFEFPNVGEVVAQGSVSPSVAGRSFDAVAIGSEKPLDAGSYLVSLKVSSNGANQMVYSHYMVLPSANITPSPESRFGMNTSEVQFAKQHRRLGIGWVRFENFKWPMISPEPNLFKFDGTVGPWHVPHDQIMADYTKEGLNVLPFLFQTPEYATSAPESVAKHRWDSYPPKDNKAYGEFGFQAAARYGTKKLPADALKSPDKKTGLNQIHVYEFWNEPNLTDPGWGPWVGTNAQYLEMFRAGAEGVKRADPTVKVTNGGTAGIDMDTIDPFRTYKYADGKRPLDFIDILNVHYYSGRMEPETATVDGNADRSGAVAGARTFEQDLTQLVEWRDRNKPGMPIWMTETGYDSAGPFGTDEYTSSARLPRVIMMMLAAGIDKVFVYREKGSDASMHAASGVFRNDGSYKPSWFTYATLIRQLDNISSGQRLPYPDKNVRLYAWKRGNETVLSAWTEKGEGNLSLKLGKSTVVDAFGAQKSADVNGHLKLSIFPTYISAFTNKAEVAQLVKAATDAEATRVAENKRKAQIKTYLYDFGSEDRIGSLDLGVPRPFTPVMSKQVYNDQTGYGFEQPAMGDDVAGWVNDPLERDAVKVGPGTNFRIKAEPGKYKLRMSVSPFSPEKHDVVVKNIVEGTKNVTVSQANTIGETTITVGNEPVTVFIDTYAMLRWISLVKE